VKVGATGMHGGRRSTCSRDASLRRSAAASHASVSSAGYRKFGNARAAAPYVQYVWAKAFCSCFLLVQFVLVRPDSSSELADLLLISNLCSELAAGTDVLE
jgi:hypothetical protein